MSLFKSEETKSLASKIELIQSELNGIRLYDFRDAKPGDWPLFGSAFQLTCSQLTASEIISRFNELYALLDVRRVNSTFTNPKLEKLGTVHTEESDKFYTRGNCSINTPTPAAMRAKLRKPKEFWEFQECEQCAKKSGTPPLCQTCIHNRDLIETLKSIAQ